MDLKFYKYQGTGNDFILIDNRDGQLKKFSSDIISWLCNRKYGIGGDGFMILDAHPEYDFKMKYYNSDGYESTMCGNGGRCLVAFAKRLHIIRTYARFESIDGMHEAYIDYNDYVKLKMSWVEKVEQRKDGFVLNTGSPHYVHFVDKLDELDAFQEGKKIRYNDEFKDKGINVNFVKKEGGHLQVKTYERGVEDETLSCGTGVVASAIAAAISDNNKTESYSIDTKGGQLKVSFTIEGKRFCNIWLEGPASYVFEGTIPLIRVCL